MKKITLPSVLKNKNFSLLLGAQLCSNIAAATILFAVINIAFSRLQSSSAIALITILYYLPGTFLGPLAGTIVDKVDKRKIFIISNLSQAGISLLFLTTGNQIFLVFPLILFYSLFDELSNPAVETILPHIVKKENLGEANTLWFFISQGSFALGSITSGAIMTIAHNNWLVFLFVSLILFLGTVIIGLIPKKSLNHNKTLKTALQDFNPDEIINDIRDGLFFLKENKVVLFPILLLTIAQAFIGTAISIAPVLAKTIDIPIASASLSIVTPGILGAIIGGAWVSQVIKRKQFRKKSLIISGITLSGLGLIGVFLVSLSSWAAYFTWILLIGLGFAFILVNIPTKTIIQEHSPFEVRGRIYGILNMLISLASILPLFLAASLTDLLGVRVVILITGLILIAFSLFIKKKQVFIFKQISSHDH